MNNYEIRAEYDEQSIVMYQAYSRAIGMAAVENKKFVAPFLFSRMTWIKPSFLWLMERSNWGQKAGQEMILAVRITRQGWEEALALGILTAYDPNVYHNHDDWQARFEQALVHVQWDTERTIRGKGLPVNSIQVGLSRHVIERYVEEWAVDIRDVTPVVRKMYALLQGGQEAKARRFLPRERIYPLDKSIAQGIGMGARKFSPRHFSGRGEEGKKAR